VIEVNEKEIEKIFLDSDFESEKEMVAKLELNLISFCKDCLDDDYIKHETNVPLTKTKRFGFNKPRIDLIVYCKNKVYGIEAKNPTQTFHELSRSVSQLLSYYVIAKENKIKIDKFILLSGSYNSITAKIIDEFKLPIELIYFKKGTAYFLKNIQNCEVVSVS
jgi:hypothetical protein